MTFKTEVNQGTRFEFGKNWKQFLQLMDDDRLKLAEESLLKLLETDTLENKSFLDIGSGSGLYSLAARRLGAKVHSFDYDPHSVSCTSELKKRFFPEDNNWIIESGNALDKDYIKSLGEFDIVYSWGVLHHTGDMWNAINNSSQCVKNGGQFYLSIYNDQGGKSKRWLTIKKLYNTFPNGLK